MSYELVWVGIVFVVMYSTLLSSSLYLFSYMFLNHCRRNPRKKVMMTWDSAFLIRSCYHLDCLISVALFFSFCRRIWIVFYVRYFNWFGWMVLDLLEDVCRFITCWMFVLMGMLQKQCRHYRIFLNRSEERRVGKEC